MLDVLLNPPKEYKASKKILKVSDRTDKPVKSILKAISWRIVGTIDTMIISYFITGKISFALSIGSLEVFTKTILYYFHERLWSHIHQFRLNLSPKSNKKEYEPERNSQFRLNLLLKSDKKDYEPERIKQHAEREVSC